MRNISVAITTRQVEAEDKTVTRRLGWEFLHVGDVLQPIRKGQGLKKGEKVEKVGGPVRVVAVHRERLDRMTDDPAYGKRECALEGFAELTPAEFVAMFVRTHPPCQPSSMVTRIEWEFVRRSEA